MLIFVRLIFVAAIDYKNIFTMKISRFTVIHVVAAIAKKSPWVVRLTLGGEPIESEMIFIPWIMPVVALHHSTCCTKSYACSMHVDPNMPVT